MPAEEDIVALAGEYVLGTLTALERAEAETRMGRDQDFAAAVLAWEGHFSPLAASALPLQPPAHLRRRILEAIGGSGGAAQNVIRLKRQLNLWRSLTIGAAAL